MVLVYLTTLSFLMPLELADGNPLPDVMLPALVFKVGTIEPIAATVGLPGEAITVEIDDPEGCFYVTAWALYGDLAAQSVPSNTACESSSGCGTSCHTRQ